MLFAARRELDGLWATLRNAASEGSVPEVPGITATF
jgi:hypothetical protein